MEVDEFELLSVGIDIGSSTSHLAFANLLLKRDEQSRTRRFNIAERNVFYEGRIINTPLLDQDTIDIERLIDFLRSEYRRAGVDQNDVQTGAVIITGETAKKQNAEQIVAAISNDAGKFVAATAGPNFESVIAAMGSGAADRSKSTGRTVLSCDIGGGTSNMAITIAGRVVSTGCIAVGGRLLAFDAQGKICRVNEPAKRVMDHLSLHYGVGDIIPPKEADRIATTLAEALIEVITGPAVSDLAKSLMVTDNLNFSKPIDEYIFSGGVSELIYGGNGDHGDIGPLLASKIQSLMPRLTVPLIEPANKIRATVIGAGAHTHVVSEIAISFKRFDLSEGQETVALYFKGLIHNSYPKLELFADAIVAALPDSIKNSIPIILIFNSDIACSVGNVIRRETDLKTNLLTLDELDLKEGDWIDIGEPLVKNQVFPVTVKSLIFHND
ncbi:MAG: ethanolamine ammonia-lyase reactivating factor EutA [Desulfosarcinaceae bacterium]